MSRNTPGLWWDRASLWPAPGVSAPARQRGLRGPSRWAAGPRRARRGMSSPGSVACNDRPLITAEQKQWCCYTPAGLPASSKQYAKGVWGFISQYKDLYLSGVTPEWSLLQDFSSCGVLTWRWGDSGRTGRAGRPRQGVGPGSGSFSGGGMPAADGPCHRLARSVAGVCTTSAVQKLEVMQGSAFWLSGSNLKNRSWTPAPTAIAALGGLLLAAVNHEVAAE